MRRMRRLGQLRSQGPEPFGASRGTNQHGDNTVYGSTGGPSAYFAVTPLFNRHASDYSNA